MPFIKSKRRTEIYGLYWDQTVSIPSIEIYMIQRGGQWKDRTGKLIGRGLFFHYKRLQEVLWPDKKWHRWNELLLKQFLEYRIIGILGPASCVAGDTKLLNPITGTETPIREFCESRTRPTVMTLQGAMLAGVPFLKGTADLIEVILENGSRFISTREHLVLTEFGFSETGSLRIGQCLLSYAESRLPSKGGLARKWSPEDVLRCSRTTPNSPSGCPEDHRFYDAQPHHRAAIFPGDLTSPIGVPAHTSGMALWPSDAQGNKQGRTHSCLPAFPLSSCNVYPRPSNTENAAWPHASLGTFLRVCDWFSLPLLLRSETPRMPTSEGPISDSFRSCLGDEMPCPEYRVQRSRVKSIRHLGFGPYYDLQVPVAHHYFAEGAIHHNSGKTHEATLFALTDYYCFPDQTTVLCSSTEREMLEMRVWGEIKQYHRQAKAKYQWLPGNLLESRQRILTDNKDFEVDGRDFRNGLCGVPCKKGGAYVGLGSYVGIKNKRLRLIADEGQFMPKAYVDAISNLNKNPDFKCIVLGNPKETTDALGMVCEPAAELGGWDGGIDQVGRTKTWKTRFDDGVCIQLVGSDSPNLDVPETEPIPFPFLITRKSIQSDIAFYGKESLQFTMMNEGRMPRGQGLRRVITRQMCLKFGAMEAPVWKDNKRTKIGFLDAAYGSVGGDRCIFGELQFGVEVTEQTVLALIDTMLVPVSATSPDLPEDQIALFVKSACETREISPQNFFFDSTGRGSLMSAFARLWSNHVVPVEFGGKASERAVSNDIKVLCKDYYSKFVSELWYTVRMVIESRQFRGMTEDVMQEGCMREWKLVSGNKVEVETKAEMKLKMGRSPDLFDALVAGVEGARRRGFIIQRLKAVASADLDDKWKTDLQEKAQKLHRSFSLNYSA